MPFSNPALIAFSSSLEASFPDWQGCKDPRFLKSEIDYKRDSVAQMNEDLSREEYLEMLEAGDPEEIIRRLDKLGKHNNLLFRGVPRSGDLGILYQEGLDKQAFVEAMFDLLHGEGDSPDRLDRYSQFVDENELPNKWTFPTYFLFLAHPDEDIFVKPRAITWFLKAMQSELILGSKPSGAIYAGILKLAHEVKTAFSEQGAADMVDVQAIIWVGHSSAKVDQEPMGFPFNMIFKDRKEAHWAFDLLYDTCMRLGVESPSDRKAVFSALQNSGKEKTLRLNYGRCLTLDFSGKGQGIARMHLAMLPMDGKIETTYTGIFSTGAEEEALHLYGFRKEVFDSHEPFLQERFQQTLNVMRDKFGHWKRSNYYKANRQEIAEAVFDETLREALFSRGISQNIDLDPEPETGEIRYWKIAPGRNAWAWEDCVKGGYILLGYNPLGDLSDLDIEAYEQRRDRVLGENPQWGKAGIDQAWQFAQISPGDRIVANQGFSYALGFGTVTGEYYFAEGEAHAHRLPVRWEDTDIRLIEEKGWRRTLIELDKPKFEALLESPRLELEINPESAFSQETFTLLERIHAEPTKEYYQANKEGFLQHVEEPFQKLMRSVAERMPEAIRTTMETTRSIFSRFLKNDYGQGGAWDYYWGAFYSKGSKRVEGAQLSLWLNRDRLEAGFYIGDYGSENKQRFARNCRENRGILLQLLNATLPTDGVYFGDHQSLEHDTRRLLNQNPDTAWADFFANPEDFSFDASIVFPRWEVLALSGDDLIAQIVDIFLALFPLVLLALLDEPIPAIRGAVGLDLAAELQPEYSLTDCALETGLAEEVLQRWVRAIGRKKQAILYGPPGTGKTFLADKLADHLIGGGSGIKELVQFHPAYAYEDFMQGLRPMAMANGGLEYPLVPGRFLQFCDKARLRNGISVLIVDEINRANLARVFGELMYLLEYREEEIPLAAGRSFSIPANVRIIGTMNTADRSIALVDHALRRRFAFLALYPEPEILRRYHKRNDTGFDPEGLLDVLSQLNGQIGDRNYSVGITFFLRDDLHAQIEDIWRMEIEPYLEEYFFDRPDRVNEFRWDKIGSSVRGNG